MIAASCAFCELVSKFVNLLKGILSDDGFLPKTLPRIISKMTIHDGKKEVPRLMVDN